MKRSFLLLTSFFFYLNNSAQAITPKPDFIGKVVTISADEGAIMLEKANAQCKVKDQFIGLEKKYSQEEKSPKCLKKGKLHLIVRAVDNNTESISIFFVERIRKDIIAKQNEITANFSENYFKHIPFSGNKYITNSYSLIINNIKEREYGITINNPNTVTKKMLIVYCLG